MLRTYLQKIILIIFFSLGLFIVESLIKYIFILKKIPEQGFSFFSGILQISLFRNTNIAFSLPLPQVVTIILVIIILILLCIVWWKSLLKKNSWQLLATSLIILGALSNLIDRLVFGYVIDYINVFFWPVFNLADSMIVIGVIIYILSEIKINNKI